MSSPENTDLPVVEKTAPLCRHLRNKGMYVYTDGHGGEPHEDYDNSIFWCLQTMKGFGPDEDFAGRDECRDPARPCYEPL